MVGRHRPVLPLRPRHGVQLQLARPLQQLLAEIQTVELNPNIAYKFNDKLSFAFGLNVTYLTLDLKKKLSPAVGSPEFELDGDSTGWGLNAAVHYKPTDWMQAGVTYRSRISQNVQGDVKVSPNVPAAGLRNMPATGDLSLPDMIFAGVNFNVRKDLTVGGGIYWTRWETYNQLQINFGAPFGPTAGENTGDPQELGQRLPLHDRHGVEGERELGPPPRLCLRPGAGAR